MTAGDVALAAFRAVVGVALDHVPVDALRGHLDAIAVARANLLADAAEAAKFVREAGER